MNCPNCEKPICEECQVCHDCQDLSITKQEEEVTKKLSQKIRGIKALTNAGYSTIGINRIIFRSDYENKPDTLLKNEWGGNLSMPQFARPCPLTPQHGFVESRPVTNLPQLMQVCKETFEADPDGQVMLTDKINADINGVWTPSLLTFGPGHDGATSGKGAVMFPLAGVNPLSKNLLKSAGVAEDQDPYVEAVADPYHSIILTQLRAGPKLNTPSPDFVPEKIQVTGIIKPDGEDLLAWAVKVKDLPAGTVVWHPGGSVTDHYSVHCRQVNVPVIITFEPCVGQILHATQVEPLSPLHVLRGLAIADQMDLKLNEGDEAVHVLLMALHNSSVMTGAWSWWLGLSAGIMLRLGSIALRGEARHHPGSKMKHKYSREAIYQRYLGKSLHFHRASLRRLVNLFKYGDWSGSFGGKKWATCGFALKPLFDAVGKLAHEQSVEAAQRLVQALNVAVNQAHNGGWWLNKFSGGATFDAIKASQIQSLLRPGKFIMRVNKIAQDFPASSLTSFINTWKKWEEVSICPPAIKDASIEMYPAAGSMMITLTAPMIGQGGKMKTITIPFQKFGPQLLNKLGKVVVVGDGQKGKLRIECRGVADTPIVLWEEDDLPIGKGVK